MEHISFEPEWKERCNLHQGPSCEQWLPFSPKEKWIVSSAFLLNSWHEGLESEEENKAEQQLGSLDYYQVL